MAFNKKEWQKNYDILHREEHKARSKASREKNPERTKAYGREYRKNHKDKTNARIKAWKLKNYEHVRKVGKEYDDAHKEDRREYYLMNKEAWTEKNKRNYRQKRTTILRTQMEKIYAITFDEWLTMLAKQHGRCAICGVHNDDVNLRLAIDHNHKTGEIRGLLCHRCNLGIGLFNECPDTIIHVIEYLRSYA